MSSNAFMAPVLPGKLEACRKLAKEIGGPRKNEYAESRKRLGMTLERVFLAQGPTGHYVMGYDEGENVARTGPRLAASSNAFDKWFMQQIREIHGMDPASVPPGPPPQLALEWGKGDPKAKSFMMAAPLPGNHTEDWWRFTHEIAVRWGDHTESRRVLGISKERVFFFNTPMGAFVLVYGEGANDLPTTMSKMAASKNPYDLWFLDRANWLHGIDFRAPPPGPAPELIASWE